MEDHGYPDFYRLGAAPGTLTAARHQDEILGPIVGPYNAWPHVLSTQSTQAVPGGIDTTKWLSCSLDLS